MSAHLHDLWVQEGHCAAIHWTRAWCNGRPGHTGPHWAPRLNPNHTTTTETWT